MYKGALDGGGGGGPMSHVECKKRSGRPVDFRGQGPLHSVYYIHRVYPCPPVCRLCEKQLHVYGIVVTGCLRFLRTKNQTVLIRPPFVKNKTTLYIGKFQKNIHKQTI